MGQSFWKNSGSVETIGKNQEKRPFGIGEIYAFCVEGSRDEFSRLEAVGE
jgi:hypothetical protein